MKTRNETKNISITGKALQITITSFFVANIMASSVGAIRACAIGLVFQMITLLFANYIQMFGHYIISAFVIIVINFIAPLYGAGFGGETAKFISADPVIGVYAGVSVTSIKESRKRFHF